jgi:outer membrane beta-barrel protein
MEDPVATILKPIHWSAEIGRALAAAAAVIAVVAAAIVAPAQTAQAKARAPETTATLEDQLKELEITNSAPAAVEGEKFYSIQTRYLPLRHRSEFAIGGGYNLTGDGFLYTRQIEAAYRFHLNDRWSLGLGHARVSNSFRSGATSIRTTNGALPEVPYVSARSELLVNYNLFYGKFRLGADKVFYFDQYIGAGPGLISANTGTVGAGVVDAGFAVWLGKRSSARLGLKDYYYNETYKSETKAGHNLHAHVGFGYVL